ncbi:hypothetical protein M569_15319, partial [Genlisea aurea]
KMANYSGLKVLVLVLIAAQSMELLTVSESLQRRIHITDDLEDVVDDEEDEAWREWGKPRTIMEFDPPPLDFNGMTLQEMQEEVAKRQFGPIFGFAKLRHGTRRTAEEISEIARKWSNVARTGSIEAKFNGFDLSTIMFTMQKGQDSLELKDWLLSQDEVYEVKIGDQLFRRPGDPSLEQVIQKKIKDDDDG